MRKCNYFQVLTTVAASLQLLAVSANSAVPPSLASPNTPYPSLGDAAAERAQYIRHVLGSRIDYVNSKKRTRDFVKWSKQGDIKIYSMHGVQADADYTREETQLVAQTVVLQSHDPFPPNRMNLDIFSTENSPLSCYEGTSPQAEEKRSIKNWELLLRVLKLSVTFSPCYLTVGLAVLSTSFRDNTWFSWLTSSIASSGAAWIKWGQWSSTRSDMFPEALCDKLSILHANAPAHSWEYSETILESSLGLAKGSLDLVFDDFEQEPIASGSIAQVHRAVLEGKLIAVKIRHPNVARLIEMDFRIMAALARIFDYIPALSWLHIRESVEQFSHTMSAQSYLNVEAHHLEVLNHNFRNWPRVQFPRPFYANAACIMESFEPGSIVTSVIDKYNDMADYINIGNIQGYLQTEKKRKIAKKGMNGFVEGHDVMPLAMKSFIVTTGLGLYLKMLLLDNLLHADLHAGNIILDFHTKKRGFDGRVTLVDAGMVAQLTEDESSTFVGLLSSMGEGDGRMAAKFALQFSIENDLSAEQEQSFCDDMAILFDERCQGYGTHVDVGHVLRGVLSLIRKHQVRIDANFATLTINILCLESLASQVCPPYNLLDSARPLLQSYRRICYTKEGEPIPKEKRSSLANFWLSLKYLSKQKADRRFFRRLPKQDNWRVVKQLH